MSDKTREAFEHRAQSKTWWTSHLVFDRDVYTGCYSNPAIEMAWQGWEAARERYAMDADLIQKLQALVSEHRHLIVEYDSQSCEDVAAIDDALSAYREKVEG